MSVLKVQDRAGNYISVVSGPKGETGPTGPEGPMGPAGSAGGARYVHVQSVLSRLWTVQHNMGAHPAVFIEDGGGTNIFGSITYVDNNLLTIGFTYSATGRVNCT